MGLFSPKYPTSDTPGATTATSRSTRRERREAEAAERGQRERERDLRTIAMAVANGGDSDVHAVKKLAGRMMPDATDAEVRQAHGWVRSRRSGR
jgi:alkylhydroperoxidase/carboxymuconolactone decarboxylase family protein YurZ